MKRIDRIRKFERKMNSSIITVDNRILNLKLILASVSFALIEILLQKYIYSYAVPNGYNPLYVYSNLTIPLAVGLLAGATPAFIVGLFTSLFVAIISNCNLLVFTTTAAATIIVVLYASKIHSRKMLMRVFIWAYAVQSILAILTLAQIFHYTFQGANNLQELSTQFLAFTLFFAATALLFPFGYLPLAEKLSGIPSNITIDKFSNLELPLLKQLALDAPGTYHHSISVGDLAKDAAEAIGANSLIARVGSYYHDIGKISCPHYYMENQTGISNPHDQCAPNISRLIIMNHVQDGICLARDMNIPEPIISIIASHHGTSVIGWFYRKALKQIAESASLAPGKSPNNTHSDRLTGSARLKDNSDPEFHFRYDGRLPRTKEESIVSLADSIEAASRSLVSPDEASLSKLVDNIIKIKIEDGQLAESELTTAELEKIKIAFTASLKHLLHTRLAYPPKNDTNKH